MLPAIKKIKSLAYYTPQKWQTFILRNYGLVADEKLAKILSTDSQTVRAEAARLGLEKIVFNAEWLKKGYITIIKNNWHILPYEQLTELLDITEEQLDYTLKEDDFLDVKLGGFKPFAEKLKYKPLTNAELQETDVLRKIVKARFIDGYAKPFDFYSKINTPKKSAKENSNGKFDKIVYSYSMVYGDTLLDGEDVVPDKMLAALQSVGVNGIWIQGVLSKLEYYPFCPALCEGYKIRQKNLCKLISKCKKYGINIYLYMNEPRAISETDFPKEFEHLKGHLKSGYRALCSSMPETKEYLFTAVKNLLTAVPEIEGIITITMSENLTNCYSMGKTDCERCKHMKKEEIVPEINNIMCAAAKASGAKTRIIANLWGWENYIGWSEKEQLDGIRNLNKDIEVLCVSEFGKKICKGGIDNVVGEYSISNVGPSENTEKLLSFAKAEGHKVLSKVQVNNSWEFAVTPYLPVFELVIKHMTNLKDIGVSGLMLSWTLGGYPSVTLNLVNEICNSDSFDYEKWLESRFASAAQAVKKAVALFSEAFTYYPFDMNVVYNAAHQLGPANYWYAEQTGLSSTMVTFPYDDVKNWHGVYTIEVFQKLLLEMCEKWREGLTILDGVSELNEEAQELQRFAQTFYVNISSMLVQIQFNSEKAEGDNRRLLQYIEKEEKLTDLLYKLAASDCRIGYEASNHYYFTQNQFLEKFINLELLKRRYSV